MLNYTNSNNTDMNINHNWRTVHDELSKNAAKYNINRLDKMIYSDEWDEFVGYNFRTIPFYVAAMKIQIITNTNDWKCYNFQCGKRNSITSPRCQDCKDSIPPFYLATVSDINTSEYDKEFSVFHKQFGLIDRSQWNSNKNNRSSSQRDVATKLTVKLYIITIFLSACVGSGFITI